jgi:hypothetical protein
VSTLLEDQREGYNRRALLIAIHSACTKQLDRMTYLVSRFPVVTDDQLVDQYGAGFIGCDDQPTYVSALLR